MSSSPVTLDFSKAQPVQAEAPVTLDFSKAQHTSVSMVGPKGEKEQVPAENVDAMRQKNYAITPDNSGVVKAVDYKTGAVNYILPSEQDSFHSAGHAIVQGDGSIRYPIIRNAQGVVTQDPLDEQRAHERVFQALNSEEKSRNTRFELKEAGKAGLKATAAGALAVAGAGPAAGAVEGLLAPEVIPVAGGMGFGGAAAGETLGPSLASQAASWAAKQLLKHAGKLAIGGSIGGGGALVGKLLHLF
jgi:hypothetical protein